MNSMTSESTRDSLKAISLLERIGQVVTSYEGTIAEIRTDATIQISELNTKISELVKRVQDLESALRAWEQGDQGFS
jgi:ribosome-binding protein aMBF1 (putative translation factor)